MSIFNSLGSNYNFNFVLTTLTKYDRLVYHTILQQLLQDKYGGSAVLLYKGREAIELALQTLNLPEDSFVAINGFTCFAVCDAVKRAGLNVEYLDIKKGELNFSAETLEKAIQRNPKIKVVIVQNTLGYPADIEQISRLCKQNKIFLIEDLAHCVGTKYSNGKEAGMVGDLVVFSFSQDKMIDAISGGALIERIGANLTHPPGGPDLKRQLKDRFYPTFTYLIRNTYQWKLGKILHFILKKLNFLSEPMNGGGGLRKLPAWYCPLIKSQFEKLRENLNHRKKIALIYASQINPKIISPNLVRKVEFSSNLRFPIFVEKRVSLIKFLADNQIFISDIWYDAPIAPKKYLSQTDYANQCPNAELASEEILNLPTHKNVSELNAERISNLINLWLKSK